MPDIATIIGSGPTNPWLMLPLAVLLGAPHTLEPGHFKSMIVTFVLVITGKVGQAALLGLSAAECHSRVIGALAIEALSFSDGLVLDKAEPWLILVSGLLIMALALRVFLVLRRAGRPAGVSDDA